jgi:hypothetical protein
VTAVKRYALRRYRLEVAADGNWVRFEDYAETVHRLRNELTALQLERDIKSGAHEHRFLPPHECADPACPRTGHRICTTCLYIDESPVEAR